MDYKKIRSTPGGKAPQFYEGEQPLTESRKGTAIPCPPRVQGGPKPRQMNTNGKHK
mgnify:CR=1 FL=1